MNTAATPIAVPSPADAARRAGSRLKRIGLGLLIALVALAALGFVYQTAATALDRRNYTAPGQMVDVGGRQMHLYCTGANRDGRPTVILEQGGGSNVLGWFLVQPEVARSTRVCAYDRAGQGWSDPGPQPRDGAHIASDLHTLLAAAGVPGPYVLAGHSYGGLIVRLFAQTHPSRTAGLVMLDAFGPPLQHLFGPLWPRYVARLNHPGTPIDADPGFETVNTGEAFASVRRAPRLAAFPMVVVSKTEPFGVSPDFPVVLHTRLEAAWPRAQQALVRLEPDTPHVYATGSDHYVQMHAPDVSIAAIRRVVTRARGGGA